jgi:hypothetical protein
MTPTENKSERTPLEKRDAAFGHLTKCLNRYGQPAHQAVAAFVRTRTGGKSQNLAVFQCDPNITDEEKFEVYRFCFTALVKPGGPDYNALNASAPAQEADAPPKLPAKRTQKPVEESEEEPALEVADAKDPLTQAILNVVLPHLKTLRAKAGVDEAAVEEISRRTTLEELIDFGKNLDGEFGDKLKKHLANGAFPMDQVTDMVEKMMERQIQRVQLVKIDGSIKDLNERTHYRFPLLIAALSQRLNVALVGPAGSSKTTAAYQASKALELEFEAISVGPMTSKSDLLGFIDANGKYHDTATVRRAEQGGVMLWDEFDTANASVATYGNMLLANEAFGTPLGMKNKHKDFCMVAGLNTYGMGANRVYVGRNQLDGATLDRFVVIDWDYDEGLEAYIIGCDKPSPKLDMAAGGILTASDWMDYVVKVRKAVEKLAIRHVVSPRASIHGTKLFLAGIGRTHVEKMVLWKGLEDATIAKIKSAI